MNKKRYKKKNKNHLFKNNDIKFLVVKNENPAKKIMNNDLKNDDKEGISLIDNISEEKEVNGTLEQTISKDFQPEIDKEELLENEEFLNAIRTEGVQKSLNKTDHNESESNKGILNKTWKFVKDIFENHKDKEEKELDIQITSLNVSQNKEKDKRHKRPERITLRTDKKTKELLDRIAELESEIYKKKIYLVDIFEKALLEYKNNHYPFTLDNDEEE